MKTTSLFFKPLNGLNATILGLALLFSATLSHAQNLAPGFTHLPKDAKIVITPLDVELFEMTAGGMLDPKADWTAAAQKHMNQALKEKAKEFKVNTVEMSTQMADEQADYLGLMIAMSSAVSLHHNGPLTLPTKEGKLDWSFDEILQPMAKATGAKYALFTWVRDSYASAERKAMIVGMAILGVGISGGVQVGYSTLVDLETGRVLWFNKLARGSGDLRDEKSATETVNELLAKFPNAQ